MSKILVAWACLSCIFHGRRITSSNEHLAGNLPDLLESLAALADSLKPVAAWAPFTPRPYLTTGANMAIVRPVMTGSGSASGETRSIDVQESESPTTSLDDLVFEKPSAPLDTGKESTDQEEAPSGRSFASFDYKHQWYPVSWAVDLPEKKPVKVTVFDTDYVIAKVANPQGQSHAGTGTTRNGSKNVASADDNLYDIIAMEDRCPHKSAALSEGRITSSGQFQCAYHGWTFDGKDGSCTEIPQVVAGTARASGSADDSSPQHRSRVCGKSVPALIQQGMVWIFPFGQLEEALTAAPPPEVPEMDMDGFTVSRVVRDFPVDYSVLLENIMDPDHGLFAHGVAGFDLYSASKKHRQEVEEEFPEDGLGGRSWKVTSRVPAVEKLLSWNKRFRSSDQKKGGKVEEKSTGKDEAPVRIATTTFHAPTHVTIGRRDPANSNSTTFLTCFWVTPTGTGRSRFMSAAVGKAPFSVPRWLLHTGLNNFLDQDTHLLAGQQVHVLDREVEQVKQMIRRNAAIDDESRASSMEVLSEQPINVRKSLYVYASPAERLSVRVGRFWDSTLSRAPKRIAALLEQDRSGVLRKSPLRAEVLDRWVQHTKVCPQSMDTVANCKKIRSGSKALCILLLAAKAWAFGTLVTAAADFGAVLAAAGTTVALPSAQLLNFASRLNALLQPAQLLVGLLASAFVSLLARKLEREFYFKYDESLRDRDLEVIPKVWADL